MKRFAILDNKTGEPYAGLRHLPVDHAQMMMLAPDKPFRRDVRRSLEVVS